MLRDVAEALGMPVGSSSDMESLLKIASELAASIEENPVATGSAFKGKEHLMDPRLFNSLRNRVGFNPSLGIQGSARALARYFFYYLFILNALCILCCLLIYPITTVIT